MYYMLSDDTFLFTIKHIILVIFHVNLYHKQSLFV